MSILSKIWSFIVRHRYIVAILLFVSIVGFVDTNSFYHLYTQKQEIKELKKQIRHYQNQYKRDTRLVKELDKNPKAMEKVAREKYYMKNPNEDVFVIE